MRSKEFITEIEYAYNIQSFRADLSKGKIVGNMENRDVVLIQDTTHEIYVLADDNNEMIAYIALNKNLINSHHPISQLENVKNTPGAITTLLSFLVANKKYKLTIDQYEGLTKSGLDWLNKFLLGRGRGMKVTDQTGVFPDIDKINQEWNISREDNISGKTSIFIENVHVRPQFKDLGFLKKSYRILFDPRFL